MTELSSMESGVTATEAPIKRVAVIGVGSMGRPMARRIMEAGFDLTVCDVKQANLKDFAALGVRTTEMPSDCAGCDAVLVLVATSEQLRAVALGDHGLRTSPAGGPRYLVVMSTVSPSDMRDLGAAFSGTPVHVVDAPVSGSVVGAEKGTLTIIAGGNEADVAALRPLFETMGEKLFHCGVLGAAQATKIVNNIIAISNLMISAEAYRVALHNGLTFERLMPVLEASSGRNFLSRSPSDAPEAYGAWSQSVEAFEAFMSISRKDFALGQASGAQDMTLPAISAIRNLLDGAGEETRANWRAIGDQKFV